MDLSGCLEVTKRMYKGSLKHLIVYNNPERGIEKYPFSSYGLVLDALATFSITRPSMFSKGINRVVLSDPAEAKGVKAMLRLIERNNGNNVITPFDEYLGRNGNE